MTGRTPDISQLLRFQWYEPVYYRVSEATFPSDSKALYGFRSSGLRWHEKFSDCLRDQGFVPCKAEPDIWMRSYKDECYEYVVVYVDDLAIALKDPQSFINILNDPNKYNFKMKGTGPISFYLGCDFVREEDGTLSNAT
jgi:Reverse transcriptase (RNA-dependent DNA polymerase)